MRVSESWYGFPPVQYIYANRRFKGVVVDPPDFQPGSWTGAGKVVYDSERDEWLLTARPRSAGEGVRGYAAEVYRSEDGEVFELLISLSKERVSEISEMDIYSIEGTQLLRSPLSGQWHLYVSVDTGSEFIWGGLYWQTLLLTASKLEGPWSSEGIVIENGGTYDTYQARDATIDIVDGQWLCLYKAMDGNKTKRPALAISGDGIHWRKEGVLTVEGDDYHGFFSGTIFAGSGGPLFVGLETPQEEDLSVRDDVYEDEVQIPHGGGSVSSFAAYRLDRRNRNLELVFRTPWEPGTKYEHKEHPLLGYSSLAYDPKENRVLMYLEAIDGELTERMGLNGTVERVLVYESRL